MLTRSLPVPETLDFRATVRGTDTAVFVDPATAVLTTHTPDGPGTVELQRSSLTEVRATAWGAGADWLLNQAPRLVGADDRPETFQPTGVVERWWRTHPFHLARTDRLWDALVVAILGQKVQGTKAGRSRRLLAYRFGPPAPGPHRVPLLPSPATTAALGYADFHRLGVERKRAEILRRVASEMPRIESLTEGTPTAAAARLTAIPGVGPWTAALVTASAMGDPDAVPVGDFHIPNTVSWHLAGEPRGTDERMLELLAPYAGHRWRVVRLAERQGSAPKYGPRLSLTGGGIDRGL